MDLILVKPLLLILILLNHGKSQLAKIQNFTVLSYDATNYDYRCSWVSGANTYYFHIGDNVDFHFLTVILLSEKIINP